MRRFCVIASMVLVVGCGATGSAGSPDGGPLPQLPACAPIGDVAPFGVRLSGSGSAESVSGKAETGTVSAFVDVYFPFGRIAGAEVVFAAPVFGGGTMLVSATLDETLSARSLLLHDPNCRSGIAGDLIGPSDGIDAIATNNLSAPSDVLTTARGRIKMCSTEGLPEAGVAKPPSAPLLPFDPLFIETRRPLSRESFASVKARAAAATIPMTVTVVPRGVTIAPTTDDFPLLTPTTLDLSGLRDILGGSLGLGSVTTIVPTTPITDFTFSSMPSRDALIGEPAETSSGRLHLGARNGEWAVAFAIGSASDKTSLRVRHRLDCVGPGTNVEAHVVSSDGKARSLRPKCAPAPYDEVVSLAGIGPYAIRAFRRITPRVPCNLPLTEGAGNLYELDELTFE